MKPSPNHSVPVRPREPLVSVPAPQRGLRLRHVGDESDGSAATDGPERDEESPPSSAGVGEFVQAATLVGRAAVGVVRLPIAVPAAVVGAGQAALGWAVQAVEVGVALPGRAQALLDEVARLVAAAGELVETVEAVAGDARRIVAEVDGVLDDTRATMASVTGLVTYVHETTVGAEQVSVAAGTTGRGVDELIALYEPLARDAAPLVQRFVDELSSGEVDAAITLVDQLPALTESVQSDVMPILTTLDRVAPDLRELLDVAKDVRKAIDGVPGSGFFRRRGEAVDEGRQDSLNHDRGGG